MPGATDAHARRDGAETVWAVVVTHNHRDLLRECLTALEAQTRGVDEILVVDNASDDGTGELLAGSFPDVHVHRLAVNEGGAGGFHAGVREAHRRGGDWLWLMDDDTLPSPTALAELLAGRETAAAIGRPPSVLASKVVWRDGTLHPMNAPVPRLWTMDDLIAGAGRGLLSIRATSFVSALVHRDAVERFGLPIKRYFIWCDDVEYTARILRTEYGYLVPGSVVEHRTATAYITADGPPERFFYFLRNTLYMVRGHSWAPAEKVRLLWRSLFHIRRFLINNHWHPRAAVVIVRGIGHGLLTPARDDG